MSEKAKALAEQHWDGYVGDLVAVHLTKDTYTKDEVLAMCRYHYVSSHIHGAKHQEEHAAQERRYDEMRREFAAASILRYPAAHPYKHKDEVPQVECVKCVNDDCYSAGTENTWRGSCNGFKPSPPADPWAERDLCRRCDDAPVCRAYADRTDVTETCSGFRPKEA